MISVWHCSSATIAGDPSRRRSRRAFTLLACAVVLGPAPVAFARQTPRVNADAQLSVDFLKRVEAYVDLHKKLEATMPALSNKPTPAAIDEHARGLARLIAQARPSAQQGDLLTRDTRAYLRRQIVRALAGPDGAAIKQSILEENLGRVKVRVNNRYPDAVPLSTTPAQILAALPKLPDDLEYRFLAERLILLDVHARMVVDYMDDAIPK
jgi:hypothetical protein